MRKHTIFRKSLYAAAMAASFSGSIFAASDPGSPAPGAHSATQATVVATHEHTATLLERAQSKLERVTALADRLASDAKIGSNNEKLRLELIGNLMRGNDADLQAVGTAPGLNEALSTSRKISPPNSPTQLGDSAADLVFVPVSPCRILDTRVAGGMIPATSARDFDVTVVSNYSSQGGASNDCGIGSAGAFAAVAINVIAVTPQASGFLTAYPYGTARPAASTVNYTAGSVVSNFAIIKLDQGSAASEMTIYSYAQSHVVADVTGYFINPQATALQCVDTANAIFSVAAGGTANITAPSCPAGYTPTATNCESGSWDMPMVFIHSGTCSAKNNGIAAAELRSSRTCCRVPGR